MFSDQAAAQVRNVDQVKVVPVINDRPLPHGHLIGDVLSVISLKQPSDSTEDSNETVVKRSSFRCLLRPDLTGLGWVNQADNKEEVSSLG